MSWLGAPGGRSWLVVIPDPGVGWLSANDRGDWRPRARATRAWRDAARQYVWAARVPPLGRAHVLAVYHHTTARRRDAGNLAPTAKACVDGMVDALVLPDDDDAHLFGPDHRTGHPVPKGRPARLSLLITELAASASDPLSLLAASIGASDTSTAGAITTTTAR